MKGWRNTVMAVPKSKGFKCYEYMERWQVWPREAFTVRINTPTYTYTNYTNHIHPPSPSLFKHCPPLNTHWYPPLDETCFSFPSSIFFSVYIDYSKGVLPWYFTHVYIVLQSDSPPHYYLCTQMQYVLILFSLYHSFSPSTSAQSRQKDYYYSHKD
jgi:hypothetical protein